MATRVEHVVAAVLGSVECDAGPELVATWCSERYRELTNRTRCKHLLRFAEVVMPAAIDAGLITVTVGSDIAVGNAAAQAAWAALGDEILDRSLRIAQQRPWLRIGGVTGGGNLKLASPVILDAGADPVAYIVVQRYLQLADDVRHLGIVLHPKLAAPLDEIAHQELDLAISSRVLVADTPRFWAESEVADDGQKRIEVYPYARTDQLLTYSYYAVPPSMRLDSLLPPGIDLHVLKAGALVDVYRWEMAKALRMNQPDVAATWRNEMNSAHTRWEDKIREAIKAERVSEVAQFMMPTGGFPSGNSRTIRDARDFVWARANRP